MIPIYITSFFRYQFTIETITQIKARTQPGTYQIHVYDNGSDLDTRQKLYELLNAREIVSLTLDSRNTGCLYNKAVFHNMTTSDQEYYVVTDNDIYPPDLSPDWLSQMKAIMDRNPDIAMLTPQFPPIYLMGPHEIRNDIILCDAVGNALKMVRTETFPSYPQKLNTFGDDGQLSELVRKNGWKVAFCRDIFCLHAGQCKDWGYKLEEIAKDPRKQGYGQPFICEVDEKTYRPKDSSLAM
jgi:cellulose synthase/poly-beta-1,6-N-acetylglucosamine synthase-like glycosyltransferase